MPLSEAEVYANVMGALTGLDPKEETWMKDLWSVAKGYIDNGTAPADSPLLFDIVLADENAPKAYKDRFSAVTTLKKNGSLFQPTVGEYIKAEKKYKEIFTSVGMADLGTNDQIKKFIENDVSADEMADRINGAFKAIDTADEFTKGVLAERFPGLTRQDIAKGLLMGKTGAEELNKKVIGGQALAEQRRFGIQSTLSEAEIISQAATQGMTQADFRKQYQTIASQKTGLEQAARKFGETSQGLLAEQEKQGILGVESQRVKGLASQARAEFGGTTGITTGSLGRKKQA